MVYTFRKRLLFALIILMLLSLPIAAIVAQTPRSEELTGWLSVIHGDPQNTGEQPRRHIRLIDDKDRATDLIMDHHQAMGLTGKKVKLRGTRGGIKALSSTNQGAIQVDSVEVIGEAPGASQSSGHEGHDTSTINGVSGAEIKPALPDKTAAVTGARPWVTLACRFADSTGITPKPISYFQTEMSSTYPGVNHYWTQVSYGIANINGSVVAPEWRNLPQPRASYIVSQNAIDWVKLANDCTALFDSLYYYPDFTGVNLMYNQDAACCAWGGMHPMTLDGVRKSWSTTWMPPWAYNNVSTLQHEMGHGFTLPHSSGQYGQVYDSRWDVMSGGGTCAVRDATLGCPGVGTISYHRDRLGWIARKFTAARNTRTTITIERLELPQSTSNYLMAQIAIPNTNQFYTVESRLKAGYDQNIPGEGVVLHKVNPSVDPPAKVVDVDNNGNTNDAGSYLVAGETFTDSANQITVQVVTRNTTSFTVTITNGTVTGVPTNTPVQATVTRTPTRVTVPTNTPTRVNTPIGGTATRTPTRAVTTVPTTAPTTAPTTGASTLKVQYKAADTVTGDNQIKPHLNVVNTGSSAVALSELKIRYYFTKDNTAGLVFNCDWAQVGCGNLSGAFVAATGANTDTYLEVSFTAGAGSLAAGQSTGEIQARLNHSDWTNFNESNDYSFDPTKTAFTDWSRVVLLRNGSVVWGTQP